MEVPREQLQLLGLHKEMIVDLFAGGGGASLAIERALGRQVDVAINHDPDAVALHEINHPQTRHYESDVFEVDPREATRGRAVGLLWASPDCTFHSRARGGKPIRNANKKRRALAWVVTRWAGQVSPRVILLENVSEFADWGPLVARRCKTTGRVVTTRIEEYIDEKGRKKTRNQVAVPGEIVPVDEQQLVPDKRRRGETFRAWVRSLERHGYAVEWEARKSSHHHGRTIRKRLFLSARRDGKPAVFSPQRTADAPATDSHLPPSGTAFECIDFSIPCPSIFERRRPLAENTLKRIARGVVRYVLENPRPFLVANNTNNVPASTEAPSATVTTGARLYLAQPSIVPVQNGSSSSVGDSVGPARTLTASPKGGGFAVAAPTLAKLRGTSASHLSADGPAIGAPLHTVGTGGNHALVSAFLAQNYGGYYTGDGREVTMPAGTLKGSGSSQSLVGVHVQRDFGQSVGHAADAPAGSVTAGGMGHAALVASFLTKYYGTAVGAPLDEPAHTVPTVDRFGLVTVTIKGESYVLVDIGMRMLQPRELFRIQGFPDWYVIDRGADGRKLTKTAQVRLCGNSVEVIHATHFVLDNVPEMAVRRSTDRPAVQLAHHSKHAGVAEVEA